MAAPHVAGVAALMASVAHRGRGLVDRPLIVSDPAGLVFTPFAGSGTLGFVTRGAPPEDLARILRWIAQSATR